MKPHPHIRKTIKWGGAALTVLLVTVWIGSAWWYVGYYNGQGRSLGLVAGSLQQTENVVTMMPQPSAGWKVFRTEFALKLDATWPGFVGRRIVSIPLWPAIIFSYILTAFAWHLDTLARRRARMNLCVKCHYDRTGLAVDAVCPECGTGSGTA